MINLYLNEIGVYQSEFGFPATKHESNYLSANLELAKIGVLKPIILSGWIRAIEKDVATAFARVKNIEHLNVSISTSEQMTNSKFQGRFSRDDIIKMMIDSVVLAKKKGAVTVGVNAEDASRMDMEFLIKFAMAAKEYGANRIRYCDTLGYDSPHTIYERIKELAIAVNLPIELHCHNDLGMAVACSIAGAKGAMNGGVDCLYKYHNKWYG